MPEETEKKTSAPKKKGGWFQKIPREIFLSPGGMVILFIVIIIEILGVLIPIPVIGFIIQLPFVIILYILLITVAKVSFKSLIIVPIIEFFFPFLPTWIIRILM
jgi:hypothetical protein